MGEQGTSLRAIGVIVALSVLSISTAIAQNTQGTVSSSTPVVVAVIDSFVDHKHPQISWAIDENLLRQLPADESFHNEPHWLALNTAARKYLESQLDPAIVPLARSYINLRGFLNSVDYTTLNQKEQNRFYKEYQKLARYFKYLPRYKKQNSLMSLYLHGTHVAALALAGLNNAKLINYAYLLEPVSSTTEQDPQPQTLQKKLEIMDLISQSLQQSGARVVNMSFETTEDIALKSLQRQTPWWKRLFKKSAMKTRARKIVQHRKQAFLKLAAENPQTVFVLAAGNDARWLEDDAFHSSAVRAPNILVVAATQRDGTLASFSNRSASLVEISALGEGVRSAAADTERFVYMSGTSMAAPIVTNQIARIFERHPEFTADQAIFDLLRNHSVESPDLMPVVAHGKKLRRSFVTCRDALQPRTTQAQRIGDDRNGT